MPGNMGSLRIPVSRSGMAEGLSGEGFRSGRLLRWPGLYGRSSGRGGARAAIAKTGWLVDDRVESMAGDKLEDNFRTRLVGSITRSSTMGCVPTSLSQEVGAALGAQAGEAKLREVITAGGFRNVRRARAPFNMILEARP